jgi:hypothetical protein
MKKNHIYIVVALLIGAVIAFALVKQGEAKVLNVNDIGADPSAFTGQITFTGIMGGVSNQDPKVVGIMDLKELKCTTPGCNKIFIPVKCNNNIPAFGDEVKVTGSFMKDNRGYIFAAENIKVVKNHKIGG